MATVIPFVPFRSEIAYNVEIKRPPDRPLAVVHDRRKSRREEKITAGYGNLPARGPLAR